MESQETGGDLRGRERSPDRPTMATTLAREGQNRSEGPVLLPLCRGRRITDSEVYDFLNVVNQAVQHPLNRHLQPAAQGKAIHPFLLPDIRKDRFHRTDPSAVGHPTLRRVDLCFLSLANSGPAAPGHALASRG